MVLDLYNTVVMIGTGVMIGVFLLVGLTYDVIDLIKWLKNKKKTRKVK